MRTFLTPGLVLILQAGSVALAGFLPSTLLDVFRPEGQQIRLNVQSFDLNHDPVYRPVDDADAGKVSAPSATARARTEKRSGHAAPPGTAFDIRRDGDEFRLVYRLDAAAKVEVAVFNAAGRLIETVASGRRAAGQGMIALALRPPAEGVYFVRIKVNDEVIVREFVIGR